MKEYERAVIFRLGRIVDKKPKGPGMTKVYIEIVDYIFVQLNVININIIIPDNNYCTLNKDMVRIVGTLGKYAKKAVKINLHS